MRFPANLIYQNPQLPVVMIQIPSIALVVACARMGDHKVPLRI
ncbi:MAG: hypothetical protein V9G16_10925 [Nitrosomonas sp.]